MAGGLAKRLTAGQAADTKQLVALLDAVAVPRPAGGGPAPQAAGPSDRGQGIRVQGQPPVAARTGIPHTIPERADVRASRARQGSRGGRPPNFNAAQYKDRNRVERAFNRLKQFRAAATRYDKLKSRYEATVTVASIVIWLRAKPDRTPSRSVSSALAPTAE